MRQTSKQYCKVEIDGRLMIVTINRPEVYNALHHMANEETGRTSSTSSQANPELWVAIITGAGDKAFSAGNDLKYHAEYQNEDGQAAASRRTASAASPTASISTSR